MNAFTTVLILVALKYVAAKEEASDSWSPFAGKQSIDAADLDVSDNDADFTEASPEGLAAFGESWTPSFRGTLNPKGGWDSVKDVVHSAEHTGELLRNALNGKYGAAAAERIDWDSAPDRRLADAAPAPAPVSSLGALAPLCAPADKPTPFEQAFDAAAAGVQNGGAATTPSPCLGDSPSDKLVACAGMGTVIEAMCDAAGATQVKPRCATIVSAAASGATPTAFSNAISGLQSLFGEMVDDIATLYSTPAKADGSFLATVVFNPDWRAKLTATLADDASKAKDTLQATLAAHCAGAVKGCHLGAPVFKALSGLELSDSFGASSSSPTLDFAGALQFTDKFPLLTKYIPTAPNAPGWLKAVALPMFYAEFGPTATKNALAGVGVAVAIPDKSWTVFGDFKVGDVTLGARFAKTGAVWGLAAFAGELTLGVDANTATVRVARDAPATAPAGGSGKVAKAGSNLHMKMVAPHPSLGTLLDWLEAGAESLSAAVGLQNVAGLEKLTSGAANTAKSALSYAVVTDARFDLANPTKPEFFGFTLALAKPGGVAQCRKEYRASLSFDDVCEGGHPKLSSPYLTCLAGKAEMPSFQEGLLGVSNGVKVGLKDVFVNATLNAAGKYDKTVGMDVEADIFGVRIDMTAEWTTDENELAGIEVPESDDGWVKLTATVLKNIQVKNIFSSLPAPVSQLGTGPICGGANLLKEVCDLGVDDPVFQVVVPVKPPSGSGGGGPGFSTKAAVSLLTSFELPAVGSTGTWKLPRMKMNFETPSGKVGSATTLADAGLFGSGSIFGFGVDPSSIGDLIKDITGFSVQSVLDQLGLQTIGIANFPGGNSGALPTAVLTSFPGFSQGVVDALGVILDNKIPQGDTLCFGMKAGGAKGKKSAMGQFTGNVTSGCHKAAGGGGGGGKQVCDKPAAGSTGTKGVDVVSCYISSDESLAFSARVDGVYRVGSKLAMGDFQLTFELSETNPSISFEMDLFWDIPSVFGAVSSKVDQCPFTALPDGMCPALVFTDAIAANAETLALGVMQHGLWEKPFSFPYMAAQGLEVAVGLDPEEDFFPDYLQMGGSVVLGPKGSVRQCYQWHEKADTATACTPPKDADALDPACVPILTPAGQYIFNEKQVNGADQCLNIKGGFQYTQPEPNNPDPNNWFYFQMSELTIQVLANIFFPGTGLPKWLGDSGFKPYPGPPPDWGCVKTTLQPGQTANRYITMSFSAGGGGCGSMLSSATPGSNKLLPGFPGFPTYLPQGFYFSGGLEIMGFGVFARFNIQSPPFNENEVIRLDMTTTKLDMMDGRLALCATKECKTGPKFSVDWEPSKSIIPALTLEGYGNVFSIIQGSIYASVSSSEFTVQVITDNIWGFPVGAEGVYVHSTYGTSLSDFSFQLQLKLCLNVKKLAADVKKAVIAAFSVAKAAINHAHAKVQDAENNVNAAAKKAENSIKNKCPNVPSCNLRRRRQLQMGGHRRLGLVRGGERQRALLTRRTDARGDRRRLWGKAKKAFSSAGHWIDKRVIKPMGHDLEVAGKAIAKGIVAAAKWACKSGATLAKYAVEGGCDLAVVAIEAGSKLADGVLDVAKGVLDVAEDACSVVEDIIVKILDAIGEFVQWVRMEADFGLSAKNSDGNYVNLALYASVASIEHALTGKGPKYSVIGFDFYFNFAHPLKSILGMAREIVKSIMGGNGSIPNNIGEGTCEQWVAKVDKDPGAFEGMRRRDRRRAADAPTAAPTCGVGKFCGPAPAPVESKFSMPASASFSVPISTTELAKKATAKNQAQAHKYIGQFDKHLLCQAGSKTTKAYCDANPCAAASLGVGLPRPKGSTAQVPVGDPNCCRRFRPCKTASDCGTGGVCAVYKPDKPTAAQVAKEHITIQAGNQASCLVPPGATEYCFADHLLAGKSAARRRRLRRALGAAARLQQGHPGEREVVRHADRGDAAFDEVRRELRARVARRRRLESESALIGDLVKSGEQGQCYTKRDCGADTTCVYYGQFAERGYQCASKPAGAACRRHSECESFMCVDTANAAHPYDPNGYDNSFACESEFQLLGSDKSGQGGECNPYTDPGCSECIASKQPQCVEPFAVCPNLDRDHQAVCFFDNAAAFRQPNRDVGDPVPDWRGFMTPERVDPCVCTQYVYSAARLTVPNRLPRDGANSGAGAGDPKYPADAPDTAPFYVPVPTEPTDIAVDEYQNKAWPHWNVPRPGTSQATAWFAPGGWNMWRRFTEHIHDKHAGARALLGLGGADDPEFAQAMSLIARETDLADLTATPGAAAAQVGRAGVTPTIDGFVKALRELLCAYGFDGVYVNWQVPGGAGAAPLADKRALVRLMGALRAGGGPSPTSAEPLNGLKCAADSNYPYGRNLTVAMSGHRGNEDIVRGYQTAEVGSHRHTHWVGLLSYDYATPTAGQPPAANAPLFHRTSPYTDAPGDAVTASQELLVPNIAVCTAATELAHGSCTKQQFATPAACRSGGGTWDSVCDFTLPAGVAFSDGNATCSNVGRWIETVPTPALQRLLKARLPGTGAPACDYKPSKNADNDHAAAGTLRVGVTGLAAWAGTGMCQFRYFHTYHDRGSCSIPALDKSKAACVGGGGTWMPLTRGTCSDARFGFNRTACRAGGGTMTYDDVAPTESALLHDWMLDPAATWAPVAAPGGTRGGAEGVLYFSAECPGPKAIVAPGSVQQSAQWWNARAIGGSGLQSEQLYVGLSTYGRGFLLEGSATVADFSRLGNAKGATPPRYLEGDVRRQGVVAMYELATSAPGVGGWNAATSQHALDPATATMIGLSGSEVVSYDNWVTLANKALWVKQHWLTNATGFAPDGIGGGIVIKALDLDDPNNGSPHHWAAACFLESGGPFAASARCKAAPWAKWGQAAAVGKAANKLSGERAQTGPMGFSALDASYPLGPEGQEALINHMSSALANLSKIATNQKPKHLSDDPVFAANNGAGIGMLPYGGEETINVGWCFNLRDIRFPKLKADCPGSSILTYHDHYPTVPSNMTRGGYACECQTMTDASGKTFPGDGSMADGTYLPPDSGETCPPPNPNRVDEGFVDKFRGWYDVSGCGQCNDYCRWVGDGGSGGNPLFKQTVNKGAGWWSCRLAGSNEEYTPDGFYKSWPYQKCSGEGVGNRYHWCYISKSCANNTDAPVGTAGERGWMNAIVGQPWAYTDKPGQPGPTGIPEGMSKHEYIGANSSDAAQFNAMGNPEYCVANVTRTWHGFTSCYRKVEWNQQIIIHDDTPPTLRLLLPDGPDGANDSDDPPAPLPENMAYSWHCGQLPGVPDVTKWRDAVVPAVAATSCFDPMFLAAATLDVIVTPPNWTIPVEETCVPMPGVGENAQHCYGVLDYDKEKGNCPSACVSYDGTCVECMCKRFSDATCLGGGCTGTETGAACAACGGPV